MRVRVTAGDTQLEYVVAAGLKEPNITARTCALTFAPNGDLAVLYGYAFAPGVPPQVPANGVALRILPAGGAAFGPVEQVWEPADGPSTTTQYVDAKYDQGGTLHLAYAPLLGAGRQVRYARRTPGGPVGGFEHPGVALGEGEYVSMGLSGVGSGDVWLSWGGAGGVLVARRLPAPVGGGWVWSQWLVDEFGSQPDLAVRQLQNGTVKAAVAYHRTDVADLYLATMGQAGNPNGWATGLPIDKPGSTGLEPSIELNGLGEPIVAYGMRDANGARWERLAYSGPFESRKLVAGLWVPSPGWNLCTFASSPGGYNSNLALDEFDTFHASYGIAQPLKKFDFGTLERP